MRSFYHGFATKRSRKRQPLDQDGGVGGFIEVGGGFVYAEELAVDEAGKDVAPGMPGELAVKGPQVMMGYWQRPQETAKVLKDGWLLTGDIATIDQEGYVRIVDRKKDMIIHSGFNIYPNEVEDCLVKHPGIVEAAVIGVPDGAVGESVKAFIVKRDPLLTAEQVRDYCKEHLAAYKVPKFVEFRDELPKSNVGKVLRKDLRAPEAPALMH